MDEEAVGYYWCNKAVQHCNDNGLLYPQLSYKLVGCFYKVHNDIGKYARERQYADKLEEIFVEQGITFERERYVQNTGNCVDFLVEKTIIIEIKAKQKISREDYYQIQRYLKARGLKLGLLVNFHQRTLRPRGCLKTPPLWNIPVIRFGSSRH